VLTEIQAAKKKNKKKKNAANKNKPNGDTTKAEDSEKVVEQENDRVDGDEEAELAPDVVCP
jgi:hypothetical protein